jgi:serine protease AprX
MFVKSSGPSLLLLVALLTGASPAVAQLLPLPPPPVVPLPPPSPPPVIPVLDKMDPLIQRRYEGGTEWSQAIVQAHDAAQLPQIVQLVQAGGGSLGRTLPLFDAVVARLSREGVAALSSSPLVRRISMDRLVVGMAERTSAAIGATAVRQAFGYDGTGIGVAVIDSGITPWHDDLGAAGVPGSQRVTRFVDFVNGSTAPYDDYGHGTHVAGVVAGNGFDSNGARSGMAPGAHLVVLKVLDSTGRGRISDVIAALEYTIQHRSELQIRVVNLSIGAGVFESHDRDLLTLAAKRAVEAGVVVVASAGNAGKTESGRSLYGGITAPGNAPWVLTVGASSHLGTIDRSDDRIAAFSSRGPTAIDRGAKPDLVAPGVGIESLSAPHSTLFQTMSPFLLNGTVQTHYAPYLSLSGTSQAAPAVAGTVALMLQADPTLTPNAVKAILQYTAEAKPEYDPLTQGAGFVNARSAIDLVRYLAVPTGSYPASPDWSSQLIWGNQRLRDGRVLLTANGWSTNVTWGAVSTPAGSSVEWGAVCTESSCDAPAAWTVWRTSCVDPLCLMVQWGGGRSENVVWGSTCGGADCPQVMPFFPSMAAVTAASDGDTVVWGTTDGGDTVVWGTADSGDTVVWGTTDDGDTVVWGTSGDGDTVVWGTSGDGGVVWDQSCEEPDPRPTL